VINLWKPERQGRGYFKLRLISLISADAYIIKFPDQSEIPGHLDVIPGKEHHRLNIWLRKPWRSGKFWYSEVQNGPRRYISNRFNYFRPDLVYHGLSPVKGRTGYMLSIGWSRNNPPLYMYAI
jgi:hypothetical protein